MAKLTARAKNLLRRCVDEQFVACYPRGQAAVDLFLAGYAEWDHEAGGGKYWLTPTAEGRLALTAEEKGS